MMTLTEREAKVLSELRANEEGEDGCVYLPNCPSSREKGWNGVLSSLAKKGLYEPEHGEYRGVFGYVKGE